jgi:lipopolysaccharide export system permease protein
MLPALRARAADPALDVRERRDARFELARRFADPFTALGFAAAAGAIGLMLRNRAWAFAAVVLLIFGFYVVWSAMPQMVKLGALPELVAAWLPNTLLLLLALGLAWRLR